MPHCAQLWYFDVTLILSHLGYCHTVFWPSLLQKDRDNLKKIQNSC